MVLRYGHKQCLHSLDERSKLWESGCSIAAPATTYAKNLCAFCSFDCCWWACWHTSPAYSDFCLSSSHWPRFDWSSEILKYFRHHWYLSFDVVITTELGLLSSYPYADCAFSTEQTNFSDWLFAMYQGHFVISFRCLGRDLSRFHSRPQSCRCNHVEITGDPLSGSYNFLLAKPTAWEIRELEP